MSEKETLLSPEVAKSDRVDMDTTVAPPITVTTFPGAKVRAALLEQLIDEVKSTASIKGHPLPATNADIIKAAVQIDSLVTVEILVVAEPILGFELPDSVVRTGGYRSIEAAIQHLMPRIEKLWKKKNGVPV